MFYVYVHIRLDTGEIFYVGKGQKKRAWSQRSRNSWWHNIVAKAGYSVIIQKTFNTELGALQEENRLIMEYSRSGVRLVNLTSGGEQPILSDESRRKISASKTGVPRSIEERLRMSIRRQGHCPGLNTRLLMSETRKGKPQPPRRFYPKLKTEDVILISQDKRPSWEIEKDYAVSQATVSRIRTGKKLK